MRFDQVRALLAAIKVFEKGGYRARHNPLLLLLAIGRAIRNLPRLATFKEHEETLGQLLRDFGRPANNVHPEYPFW